MFFSRNSEHGESSVHLGCQMRQGSARFHANPKNSCCFDGWKKSVTLQCQRNRRYSDRRQSIPYSRDLALWLFADEFQRHVQGFRLSPARVRGEAAHAFKIGRNTSADAFVQVERHEETHGLHQLPAEHIERLLRSKAANAATVAGEMAFLHVGAVLVGYGVEN